jgi:hypothetical protein
VVCQDCGGPAGANGRCELDTFLHPFRCNQDPVVKKAAGVEVPRPVPGPSLTPDELARLSQASSLRART